MQAMTTPTRTYTIHSKSDNRLFTLKQQTHKQRPMAVVFENDIEAIRVARLMENKQKVIIRNWQNSAFYDYCKENDLDFMYVTSKSITWRSHIYDRQNAVAAALELGQSIDS